MHHYIIECHCTTYIYILISPSVSVHTYQCCTHTDKRNAHNGLSFTVIKRVSIRKSKVSEKAPKKKQEKNEESIEEKKLLARSFLCDVINVHKSRLNKRTKITRTEHVVRHGRKFIMGRDGAPYKAEAKQALSISCCL